MPSLREKKRFLVFEVDTDGNPDIIQINDTIASKFKDLFGLFGLADAGLLMLNNKYDNVKKRGIIRVNHKNVDKLRASFALIDQIKSSPASIRSLGLSGILRKAEKMFL